MTITASVFLVSHQNVHTQQKTPQRLTILQVYAPLFSLELFVKSGFSSSLPLTLIDSSAFHLFPILSDLLVKFIPTSFLIYDPRSNQTDPPSTQERLYLRFEP